MITATVVAGSVAKQLNLGSIVALLVVGIELGFKPDSIEPIMNSLRAADYASIRRVGGTIPESVPKDAEAKKEERL